MKWKSLLRVGLIILIVIFLTGVFSMARVIVRKGSALGRRVTVGLEETEVTENEDKPMKKEFNDNGERWQTVSLLFDDSNLGERQHDFLGSEYVLYEDALSEIERSSILVFNSIEAPSGEVPYERVKIYEKSNIDIFSDDFINGDDIVYLRVLPEIIGLYNEYTVVYRVDLIGNDLIAVDYSTSLLDTEKGSLFDFGQHKNLMIDPKYSKLIKRDDYNILYMKEY